MYLHVNGTIDFIVAMTGPGRKPGGGPNHPKRLDFSYYFSYLKTNKSINIKIRSGIVCKRAE